MKAINAEGIYKRLKGKYIERYKLQKGDITPEEMAENFRQLYHDLGGELAAFVPTSRQTAFAEIMDDFGFVTAQHQLFYKKGVFPALKDWERLAGIAQKSDESVNKYFDSLPENQEVLRMRAGLKESQKNNKLLAEFLRTNPSRPALLTHPATRHYRDHYEAILLSMKIAAQEFRPLQHEVPKHVMKAVKHALVKLEEELTSIHEAIAFSHGRKTV